MKVCFLSHSSNTGGAERVLLETIEVLQEEGIECRVLLPSYGELCAELGRLNIPYSIVSYPLWMRKGETHFYERLKTALNITLKAPVIVWKIFRWKCDFVYTNTVTVCIGAIAARLLRCPHIWHIHEFGAEDHNLSFLFGERLSLKGINWMSSRCVFVSRALAKKYEQVIDASKMTIIYPSMHRAVLDLEDIDCDKYPFGTKKKRFRCIIVGSLVEGKGQEDAILAFVFLQKLEIDAELIIVGDGEPGYRQHLEDIIKCNSLTDNVTFIGRVKGVLRMMESADVLLICSRCEAFGRVTIEGMLAGKPIIGAQSGATSELIEEGSNGLFYKSRDPKDLADKIQYLYQNPDVAERLGRNARTWSENIFTRERYRKELLKLLSSSVGRGSILDDSGGVT